MSILCYTHKIDITKTISTALPKAKTAFQASLSLIFWINSYPEPPLNTTSSSITLFEMGLQKICHFTDAMCLLESL
jgi:hypothetical protein